MLGADDTRIDCAGNLCLLPAASMLVIEDNPVPILYAQLGRSVRMDLRDGVRVLFRSDGIWRCSE